MKVTFPNMGNLWIVVKAILEDLDLEVVAPSPPSRESLETGVRHSPEFACFPLKLNIGDFVGAIGRGAEAIMMAGGIGPCRFGHYAQVEAQVLRDLGYDVEMIVLEPHLGELWRAIRHLTGNKPLARVVRAVRFGWEKLKALDELDRALARARASRPGGADARAAHRGALRALDAAGDKAGIRRALAEGLESLADVAARGGGEGRPPLRVGVVGEVFMIAEPFANQDIERRLGDLGVLTRRALYLSDWVREHLLPPILEPERRRHTIEVRAAARPYLRHFVGGEGLHSVGETVLFDIAGCDGVVQVAPFTCMPEIVAASLLPEVGRDLGLPVMSLFLDEHTGEAGLQTRLEAFVDLLGRRRDAAVARSPRVLGAGGQGGAGR